MITQEEKEEIALIIKGVKKMIDDAFRLHEQKESVNESKIHLELSEKFDQAVIAARESLQLSISQILGEVEAGGSGGLNAFGFAQ